jgi:ankyrin repeat protein
MPGSRLRGVDIISDHPAILTFRNGIGETVLHFLAVENDLEGVAWLHDRGSSLDTKNEFGTPVLFEVAQLGYEKLVLWFIEHGANIRAIDSSNQGIVEYLQEFQEHERVAFVRKCGA